MSNILILSNDAFRPKAKTCEYLAGAARRLGHFAMVRDTSETCFALNAFGKNQEMREFHENVVSKYLRMIDFFEIDTILSLDLDWCLFPDEFLEHSRIRRVYSLWFDDLRTWMTGELHPFFPSKTGDFFKLLQHPKILHCFYGKAQQLEAQELNLSNHIHSPLAAASELLAFDAKPEVMDRLAFIGNPGYRQQPHPAIVKKMQEGADLQELRTLSHQHILHSPPEEVKEWFQDESSVRDLLEFSTQVRIIHPFKPAMEIIQTARSEYPEAIGYLTRKQQILTFALLVKLVNHYDRPAMAYRLYERKLIDVYSSPEEWELYGIKSRPFVNAQQLPSLYQQYGCHLNAPNPIRDASGNEKLFEIAASARLSVNLESPDVLELYSGKEIATVQTLAELEEKVSSLMKDPEGILGMGAKARSHTKAHHTWEHRLQALFKNQEG